MISHTTKQFSQSLLDVYGDPAENAVVRNLLWLNTVRAIRRYPDGKYGVDLLLTLENNTYLFMDVERRKNWIPRFNDFPFPTLHIPFRKKEMMETKFPFSYCAVRDDLKKCLFLDGISILESNVVENRNVYVANGELFFSVPVSKIQYYLNLESVNDN